MEALLWSSFTPEVIVASGSGRKLKFRCSERALVAVIPSLPPWRQCLGDPVLFLFAVACVALSLCRWPGGCAASGSVWRLEQRLRVSSAIEVLPLVAWVVEASTWLVRGLGAGVEAGAAAPEIVRDVGCFALVTWVTELTTRLVRGLGAGVECCCDPFVGAAALNCVVGVVSGHLGGRVVSSSGSQPRGWSVCVALVLVFGWFPL
jgi:hypothetical protein